MAVEIKKKKNGRGKIITGDDKSKKGEELVGYPKKTKEDV